MSINSSIEFKEWLCKSEGFSAKTASDAVSRVKRIANLAGIDCADLFSKTGIASKLLQRMNDKEFQNTSRQILSLSIHRSAMRKLCAYHSWRVERR